MLSDVPNSPQHFPFLECNEAAFQKVRQNGAKSIVLMCVWYMGIQTSI